MANVASVAYAIEGPKEVLEEIQAAIIMAVHNIADKRYEEYQAAEYLKLPIDDNTRLGGEIYDEPTLENGVLKFWAEERWGLQDFAELLEGKFPEIKIKAYWTVEESGCGVYVTNDKEGKYFPERYWVDTCIDGIYNSEYFKTEKDVYEWLDQLTYGRVKSFEDAEKFNSDYEDPEAIDENFISVHEFEIV